MTLSLYHQKYASHSNEEIQRRVNAKEEELKTIFKQVSLKTNSEIIEVAVLGCADKRFVKAHKKLFEKYTGKPVHLTTFDITTKHLKGEENVLEYDCTKPLPNRPYDITYGHVLLKFIHTDKQWDVIKNSYDALKQGGIAIHGFDKEPLVLVHFTKCLIFLAYAFPRQVVQTSQAVDFAGFLITSTKGYKINTKEIMEA